MYSGFRSSASRSDARREELARMVALSPGRNGSLVSPHEAAVDSRESAPYGSVDRRDGGMVCFCNLGHDLGLPRQSASV